jgi:secondary thiamine-phosphate synthase enzyme
MLGRPIPCGSSVLRQHLQVLSLKTSGAGFTTITAALNREIAASGLRQGVATLVCLHTSCSLMVNENADPRVLQDLAAFLDELVPSGNKRAYLHDDEGPDDMPAHIRTALTATSLQLSFERGGLLLGTWQAVYLWEHRRLGSQRRLSLHLIGE